jgi:hypothetical protein
VKDVPEYILSGECDAEHQEWHGEVQEEQNAEFVNRDQGQQRPIFA